MQEIGEEHDWIKHDGRYEGFRLEKADEDDNMRDSYRLGNTYYLSTIRLQKILGGAIMKRGGMHMVQPRIFCG